MWWCIALYICVWWCITLYICVWWCIALYICVWWCIALYIYMFGGVLHHIYVCGGVLHYIYVCGGILHYMSIFMSFILTLWLGWIFTDPGISDNQIPPIDITFIFILRSITTFDVRIHAIQVTHTMTKHFDGQHTNKLFIICFQRHWWL